MNLRFRHDFRTRWFVGLALAVLTVGVYSPSLRLPFLSFDDLDYVTQNRHVKAGLTAAGARWAFTTFACGNWHPLTWLSLQLDRELYGGLRPGGFHLTNVLLHAANTWLLFAVLARLTGSVWRSAAVAALFAWHPLHVESVAWVAERKGLLAALFWMLTLAAYLHYVRRPGPGRYLLVVLALVGGLMAKPLLLSMPAVLLLLDYWPLRRWRGPGAVPPDPAPAGDSLPGLSPRRLLLEKVPLAVLVLAWAVLAFLAQHHYGALPSLDRYPWGVRVCNAALAYVAYLGKVFWPAHLAAHYPHPGSAVSVAGAAAAAAVLLAVTALVLGPGRPRPYLAVGWLWYLGTMVPTVGLVQIGTQGMADRYTYVPLVGVFLLLTWGAADWAGGRRLPRPFLAALAAVPLAACAALTWVQLGYWKSDRDLWEHALAVTENNYPAHNNLGVHYYQKGQIHSARKEFEAAAAIDPTRPLCHDNLAGVLRDLGRREEALLEYQKAVALDPHEARFHLHLGTLLRELGRAREAFVEFREATELNPELPAAHNNLAAELEALGRTDEAQAEYQKAVELDPEYEFPHIGLGNLLSEDGRFEEAEAHYRRAIALNPRNDVAHYNLGMALQKEGRLDEALAEYRKAQELGMRDIDFLLHHCERLAALRLRLPALLAGQDRPADNRERWEFADLCAQPFEGRYALAARLYADVFRIDPALAEQPRTGSFAAAAIAAARAGCGEGMDAAGLDEREKARLRLQALRWLRIELPFWIETARRGFHPARAGAQQMLRLWKRDRGLAGVRDPAALATLPPAEREAWQRLWQEVEGALAGPQEGDRPPGSSS
jgi:tetratricopeptide (TPR) repeat protein